MRDLALSHSLVILFCAGVLTAQTAPRNTGRFAVGDKVKVSMSNEVYDGEVVEVMSTGPYRVKFMRRGRETTLVLPVDRLTAIAPGPAKPMAPTAGNSATPAAPAPTPAQPASPAATKPPLRTWTDSSGKFKIEARLIELKDNQVTLARADGTEVVLALDRLSEADQKVAKESAAAPATANPFPPATGTPAPAAEDAKPPAGQGPQLTEPDLSSMRTLEISDPGTWQVQVEGLPAPAKLATKPIVLGGGKPLAKNFFEDLDSLLFVPRQSKAYAVTMDRRSGQNPNIALHLCDLATGKSEPPLMFPARIKPVDIDPTGQWLVAHPDFFLGNKGLVGPNEVTLCKLGKDVQHQLSWTVESKTAPSLARFVGSDHLLTVGFPNKLVLWEAAKAKAVYTTELMMGCLPGISPGHQYLAVPLLQGLFLVKAQTGETVGKLPWEVEGQTYVSFRPDGKQLAAVSFFGVQVFDLQTGELYRNIRLPDGGRAPDRIDWVADGYLLLNGCYLVDLTRRTVLWQYYHRAGSAGSAPYGEFGGRFWFALNSDDRKQYGIFHTALPTDDAKTVAAGLRPEDNLAVKPGARIALRLNLSGSDDEQRQAREALTRRIKEVGLVLADESRLVLEASTQAGESREVSFTPFGFRGQKQTTTFTEQVSRARLLEDDKELWQASTKGHLPSFLSLKEGQTLDDALAPYQKPNLKFFAAIKLPSHLARTPEKGAYGATNLTAQGPTRAEVFVPKKPGE